MHFKEYYKNRKFMEQEQDGIPLDSPEVTEKGEHGINSDKLSNFLSCILSNYDNVQKVIAKMQELGFEDKTGKAQEMMAKIDWEALHREAKNFIMDKKDMKDNRDATDVVKPSAADAGTPNDNNEFSGGN